MDANPEHKAAPKAITGRINGRFAPGYSGNPGGSPEATRRAFNKRFLLDLAGDWQQHGREVLERVRRESPASYLKVCAMLVPKEMRVEHSQSLKSMSDEELDAAIAAVRQMLDDRAAPSGAVIEGTVETVALPAPAELEQPQRKRPNRVLEHADTAVGPRERKARKCKARKCKARKCKARKCKARKCKARKCKARKCKARKCKAPSPSGA
jgi:hypothetical protein